MKLLICITLLSCVCWSNARDLVSEFLIKKFNTDGDLVPSWYREKVVFAYLGATKKIADARMVEYLEKTLQHLSKKVNAEFIRNRTLEERLAVLIKEREEEERKQMADLMAMLAKRMVEIKATKKRKAAQRRAERKRKAAKRRKAAQRRAARRRAYAKKAAKRRAARRRAAENKKRKETERRTNERKKKCKFDVAETVNRFHSNIQQHVADDETKNTVFSPLSLYLGLAALSLGAAGNTKNQITSALGWKAGEKHHMDAVKYITRMSNEDRSLDIANKGWVASGIEPPLKFQREMQKYFGVQVAKVNFGKAEKSRANINNWVSNHTGKMIKELFPPRSITELTIFVLASAISFNGKWTAPFDEKLTRSGHFTRAGGQRVSGVQYMTKTDKYKYTKTRRRVQVLELPYEEGYSMLFAKPPASRTFIDISKLSKEADDTLINKWLSEMIEDEEVDIKIPRFTVKHDINNLKGKLGLLGIKDVFLPGADLSGIYSGNLYVSSVIHKAAVDVNEAGTKASAATGITGVTYSLNQEVFMDSPFLFFILKKPCNSIVFSGRVMDPTQ